MPFNPRNLSSTGRFGDKKIPIDRYHDFLKLNSINNKNLSDDFDKLVYSYLTDHYFNINLLYHFICFSIGWGICEDYGIKLNDKTFAISSIIVSALCQLPSWHLKQFFWDFFYQNFKNIISEDMSKTLPELLRKTATDIYNFSLVYYPLYKSFFKNKLCAELNVNDETLLSNIKSFISSYAKKPINFYPDYSIEFMEKIDFKNRFDKYILSILTKDFYSIPRAELLLNDEELTINNYYQKVNEIVRHRIRIISRSSRYIIPSTRPQDNLITA